ncbi:TonB family protein [Roseomonas sp. 18066]|uniref:TonB family protein n=1 Tax=Roseomonas sp. 18066 TaxID=2681412 RepID=UPI001357CA19|nr:TonB family protein [Roseomonas sp. 18066]
MFGNPIAGRPALALLPLAALLAACAAPASQGASQGALQGAPQAATPGAEPAAAAESPEAALARWSRAATDRIAGFSHDPRDMTAPAASRGYPAGTVAVRFSVDRVGRVLGPEVVKGSGQAQLDGAALIMVAAAQPLPPPPAGVLENGRATVVVPVHFQARRAPPQPTMMGPK